jgi:hypothetical protein
MTPSGLLASDARDVKIANHPCKTLVDAVQESDALDERTMLGVLCRIESETK